MTSESRKLGQREEVPDDWFSKVDARAQTTVSEKQRAIAEAPPKLPSGFREAARRFRALVIPSAFSRLVFTLSLIIVLPVAFDFVDQLIQNFGYKIEQFFGVASWAFLFGFLTFSLGATACGKFATWERVSVFATAALAAVMPLTYVTPRATHASIREGVLGFRSEKAAVLVFFSVASVLVIAGITYALRSREQKILSFFANGRNNLFAGLGVLVFLLAALQFSDVISSAAVVLHTKWHWWIPTTLFGLLAIVFPIISVSYSKNIFWLFLWAAMAVLWSFVIFNFGNHETLGYQRHILALTVGFTAGMLIAIFGTFRNRHLNLEDKSRSWQWALIWSFPLWVACVAMLFASHHFFIPAIYKERVGFQWEVASELGRISKFAEVDLENGRLTLDFTRNRDQEEVSDAPVSAIVSALLELRGVDESLNVDFLPSTNSSVQLTECNVTLNQLAKIDCSTLILEKTTVSDVSGTKLLSGPTTLIFRHVPPGTLTTVVKHLEDPLTLSSVQLFFFDLNDVDWITVCKLAESTPVRLHVQIAERPTLNSERISEVMHELPASNQLSIFANFAGGSERTENYWQLVQLFSGANVEICTNHVLTIESGDELSYFDLLFLNRGRLVDYSGIAEMTYEKQSAELLRKKHLVYSSLEVGEIDSMYLPQLVWSDPEFFELATEMRCLSFDEQWRLGTGTGIKSEPIHNLADNIVFAAEELYLGEELVVLPYLNRFPNLEVLQIRWPLGAVSADALNQLGEGIETSPKLKKFIWEGGVYTRVLESLQKCAPLEELVLLDTDVTNFGLDNIRSYLPNTKITVVNRDQSGPNCLVPRHFLDHHDRVIEKIRAKATAKIKQLEDSPAANLPEPTDNDKE